MLQPDPIDVHVGRVIRAKRLAKGLTLDELAHGIGLSHQQVHKYEKGVNRISASMLYRMARVLDVAPDAFFRDLSASNHLTHC
jgi:transcriptional regulator with XRE-family HTH domain